MKTLFVFIVMFIIGHTLLATEVVTGNMAILTDGIAEAKQKDASIIFNIMTDKIISTENVKGKIFYYDNEKKIIKDFVHHKIDYLMINPLVYLQNQKILDKNAIHFWSIRRFQQQYQKMIIIVRKHAHINNVSDLQDKTVAIKEDNYLGEIVLKKALYESKHLPTNRYINNFVFLSRDSTAILKTFFGKSDAAIVPAAAFDIVCEMNPKVKKNLKVIYTTERIFMPIISMMNKNSNELLVLKISKLSKNMNDTPDGQSMFAFFKIHGIDIIKPRELKSLKKYYLEYIILKKKYGEKK